MLNKQNLIGWGTPKSTLGEIEDCFGLGTKKSGEISFGMSHV